MKTKTQVTCYGEILWDVFPTHKVIGGAPLNVALRLKSFDVNAAMISSIGQDAHGDKALEYLKENKLDASYVQIHDRHETGHVIVSLDEKGSASYEIFKPVAWDFIEVNNSSLQLVANSEVFVFGSLVCRAETSKSTLLELIEKANYKVFDVNLRKPDYTIDLILELMSKVDFVKMNDEELDEICEALGYTASGIENQIHYISSKIQAKTICITLGSKGALLFHEAQFYNNSGYKVEVEDTVGAGDSFLASLITKLLIQKSAPQESIDFACAVGSLVASKKGANSKISNSEINQFLK